MEYQDVHGCFLMLEKNAISTLLCEFQFSIYLICVSFCNHSLYPVQKCVKSIP